MLRYNLKQDDTIFDKPQDYLFNLADFFYQT